MKKNILTPAFLLISIFAIGQDAPKYVSEVYNRLFTSMSNGTIIKPRIKLKDDTNLEISSKEVATYSPVSRTITIGKSFIELTRKFGKDSTNARVHVLSHELAHLFLNHGFVSVIGTGFASKEINKEFRKTIEALDNKMGESEADQWASFYAYIAGYETNQVAPRLLDSIYKYYHLSDKVLNRYPPLSERKRYAIEASVKMKSMCEAFDFANISLIHKDYNLSIEIYNAIIQEGFKSREIVSNLGTAYLLKAISLIDITQIEYILPLQIDMDTRMQQHGERGLSDNDENEINELLGRSEDIFRQAISIDPEYSIAYFNLSIAYWLHKEVNDAEYYLAKAKDKMPLSHQNEIKLFESIIKLKSTDENLKKEGLSQMKRLNSEGYSLAKANMEIINKSSEGFIVKNPEWVTEISKKQLPSNFQNSNNILDSTFSKDKYRALSCKEVGGIITYRKWKYINDQSYIAIQYIFKECVNKTLSPGEKRSLILSAKSIFEASNCTYICFQDVVLILDRENNIQYQIIKTL